MNTEAEPAKPKALPPLRKRRRNMIGELIPYLLVLVAIALLCAPAYLIGRGIIVAGFMKTAEQARQTGKFDEAIVNYNSAMQWSVDNEEAFSGRWGVALQTGNIEGAIADYSNIINNHAGAYLPYCYRGQAYRRIELNDQARADLEACLARNPDDAWRRSATSIIDNIKRGR